MTKEELNKLAEKEWEVDQEANPNPINPQAFVYGYKVGFRNKDRELSLLTEKYAKMELMYDKLANIHSKQEEKYNKLKEAFEDLLKSYLYNAQPSHQGADIIKWIDAHKKHWNELAGLKEQ